MLTCVPSAADVPVYFCRAGVPGVMGFTCDDYGDRSGCASDVGQAEGGRKLLRAVQSAAAPEIDHRPRRDDVACDVFKLEAATTPRRAHPPPRDDRRASRQQRKPVPVDCWWRNINKQLAAAKSAPL